MNECTHRRAFLAACVASMFAAATVFAKPNERVVHMMAKRWAFIPATVKAAKGETLVLLITAPEVPMGFNLPDFNLRVDVVPGKVATLKVTADKPGTFTFLCDVFCGEGHERMNGQLVVSG